MRSNYRPLGDFIQRVDIRNRDLQTENLRGLSMTKEFRETTSNIVGTDLRKYKIIGKNQFACDFMSVIRVHKLPVVLHTSNELIIVSPAYTVFEIKDENILDPQYLMMWFRRDEFDRYADFKCDSAIRGGFKWDELCEVQIPIPCIETQQEIVNEYHTITKRIQLNEQLNQKLEETAQALYKHWFVDFEFPCLPSDYRPHGQVNLKISDDDLRSKIAQVCTYKRMGGLPISDGRIWFIYLILCDDDSIYKGITNDLYRRFYEHYTGLGAKHTQKHKPIKVIHWESFETKEEAAKREKDLKTGYGRTWISRQIEKAGGLHQIKTGLPAPTTQLRTAGKMVYNEELDGEIPEGWKVKQLDEVCRIFNKKRRPISGINRELIQGCYPYYGAMGIVDHINDYIFDGTYLLVSEDGVYVTNSTGNPSLQYVWGRFWVNNHTHILQGNSCISTEFLMLSLMNTNVTHLVTGAAQPKINLGNLSSIQVLLPSKELLSIFDIKVGTLYKKYKFSVDENKINKQIIEILLSKMATVGSEEEIINN